MPDYGDDSYMIGCVISNPHAQIQRSLRWNFDGTPPIQLKRLGAPFRDAYFEPPTTRKSLPRVRRTKSTWMQRWCEWIDEMSD